MKMIGIMEEMKMGETAKKAILAVSFGTSHSDTRKVTIDAIEEDLKAAFEDCSLYRAWTSKMILARLEKRDGIHYDNVKEAMEHMLKDGITDVIVQPTHVMNGVENDLMKEDVLTYAGQFQSVTFGTPLLTTEEDNELVVKAIAEAFPAIEDKETALVLMGHGTEHYANAVYAALDYRFKDMGHENVIVGTVEGYPEISQVLKQLEKCGPKKSIKESPYL